MRCPSPFDIRLRDLLTRQVGLVTDYPLPLHPRLRQRGMGIEEVGDWLMIKPAVTCLG